MPVQVPLSRWTDAKVKHEITNLTALLRACGVQGDLIAEEGKNVKNIRGRVNFYRDRLRQLREDMIECAKYKNNKKPIGVREFITSPNYMNASEYVWPKVIDEIEECCNGTYVEGVFTGGIGCAKSTAALYIQAYMLYAISCLKQPHAEFGLDPASEIMFIFQSLNATVAKAVEYERFREMIERSPYFMKNFRHDYDLKTQMKFPNRIIVKAVSGDASAAIGQNVISAIIDEVNFMQVVQKSKMAVDGGVFNQAMELYTSIVRRRESRFEMAGGKVWGMLCLVSSARYPGQFTDRRKQAAKRDKRIFIYDKRQWDIRPEVEKNGNKKYSGVRFNLFLGDPSRKPRILGMNEDVPFADRHLVMEIPIEHKHAFDDDLYDSIRDIAGMATLATHPFIPHPERIAHALQGQESIFSRADMDFVTTKALIYPKRFKNLEAFRYVHCDLSLTGDSCGITIGHVTNFRPVPRSDGLVEMLPVIRIDGMLEIVPPKGGEIDLARVRGLIYKLRDLGLPIKWVSYDSFNSADSIQIMKQQGFVSGLLSMDVTPVPYEFLKQTIIDGRLEAPEHEKCQMELLTLERDPATGKIDHTEVSSKDVSDSLAGVVYGLTMRREVWMQHQINPTQIPRSVTSSNASSGKRGVEGGTGDRDR